MKKVLNILAVVIPVLAAITFLVLFVTSSSNLGSTRQSLAALQTTSTADIGSKDQEIALQSTAAATLVKGVGDLQATNAMMETQKKDLLDKYTAARIELDDLKGSVLCESQLKNVDFSSNATVSKALLEFMKDRHGSELTAEWEVVWNNSRTAIHKITGEYLWLFLVYFDEPDMGYKNTIFSIDARCYLYRSPA